jgi:hypothetical protein
VQFVELANDVELADDDVGGGGCVPDFALLQAESNKTNENIPLNSLFIFFSFFCSFLKYTLALLVCLANPAI